MIRRLLGVGALCLALGPLANAGTIEPDLQSRMAEADDKTDLPAIVMMADRVNLDWLTNRLDQMNASRQQRHEIVVRTLQDKAQATQGPLLETLERLKGMGLVKKYTPLWITNGVLVTARKTAFLEIAAVPGTESLYSTHYQMDLVRPVASAPDTPGQRRAVEPGLTDIKADFLWNLGFTGQGRLVSNIDTGVDGTHGALASRWRGLDPGVTVAETWFDPVTNTTFPFDAWGHGTHTMGTITGKDATNTVGVAYGAKWIAAGTIDRVDIPTTVADAILSFQWVADPDNNPATVADVPDVCSNSWGLSPLFHGYPPCDTTFWESIDGAEAAGVAVVFAAGNEGGWGAQSLRTPADRIKTGVDTFSIGALLTGSQFIASFSSLGPSGCNGTTKKPEVCAQGDNVRSAWPGGGYLNLSGTSMACPHAAGAVTLLRQVHPNISSRRVKEIIFETADDLGSTGEDNTYGAGRINLQSAYNKLISEIPAISTAVVTTTYKVNQGALLWSHIAFTEHTGTGRSVNVAIDVKDQSNVTILNVVSANIFLPGNFNNEPNPIVFPRLVPNPTPIQYRNVPLYFVVTVKDNATQNVLSSAQFEFKIN